MALGEWPAIFKVFSAGTGCWLKNKAQISSIQLKKGTAQLSAAKTCSKVNATLFEEIKFNACQIAFIPRSLDNEPLRMRYSGSCGTPRLRPELPCNQHTTFSPHCQELSRHKRSVTCNHLFRSKRNRAHQKSSHFPEVNATFAPYICVYFWI